VSCTMPKRALLSSPSSKGFQNWKKPKLRNARNPKPKN
jgi:hypothetical protein